MPRNVKANRPSCPAAYVYIEECEARLAGSKPIRTIDQRIDEHIDEGRRQVWRKVPGTLRNAMWHDRRKALGPYPAGTRKALEFNIAWIKERYAP